MKKIIVLVCISCLINSCKNREPILIEEIDTDEIVTITYNEKKIHSKDSVDIHFPKEFKIVMNSKNIIALDIYYVINKKMLADVVDYEISDKKNTKPILTFESYLSSQNPINIIIKERNYLISKKDAEELLKRYNIKQSLDKLKFGDTIKLIPYNHFRNENNKIINDLKRVEDSIFFRVTLNKGEIFVKREKINW
ncbi:hypothetical protein IUY40_09365 [Flavobacterium sp. ALJ2]|uniref:hypothetical protein n=1 Tax=Flavobacterium sp. ALJ2 TaxID=2786960 RepID=UPI00189F096A|nr:hypothetical protein [Flavobacterium sp. ALJ2]MBF7091750.1 hypothetical protein [Flavobacterium sp. ALJ2]